MSTRDEYLALQLTHPEWFQNPPGAAVTILLGTDDMRGAQAEQAARLAARAMPVAWAHVGIAYRDQYFLLLRDAVRFADGTRGTYVRFMAAHDGPTTVIVVPVFQRQLLLVRHFRHATRTWHLEFPAGAAEVGVSAAEQARRELSEEIGASVSRLTSLGRLYDDVGKRAEYTACFYAEVERYALADARDAVQEGIAETRAVSPAEFERMVSRGEINAMDTIAAYAASKARGLL